MVFCDVVIILDLRFTEVAYAYLKYTNKTWEKSRSFLESMIDIHL